MDPHALSGAVASQGLAQVEMEEEEHSAVNEQARTLHVSTAADGTEDTLLAHGADSGGLESDDGRGHSNRFGYVVF